MDFKRHWLIDFILNVLRAYRWGLILYAIIGALIAFLITLVLAITFFKGYALWQYGLGWFGLSIVTTVIEIVTDEIRKPMPRYPR